MDLRKDPMAGAAEMISDVIGRAERIGRPAVTTVGRINAEPNMRAFLTRDSDYFVPLGTRVNKARAVSADLFVSVHDDGCGFDAATTAEGVGLGRSIRARIVEVGGQVEVASEPGSGTEVSIRLAGPATGRD